MGLEESCCRNLEGNSESWIASRVSAESIAVYNNNNGLPYNCDGHCF